MEEKYMVNDILQNSKEFVKSLNETILESSNLEFRQIITTLRNSAENFEGEIYKIAESKGYYSSATKAEESEIIQLRKKFI